MSDLEKSMDSLAAEIVKKARLEKTHITESIDALKVLIQYDLAKHKIRKDETPGDEDGESFENFRSTLLNDSEKKDERVTPLSSRQRAS